MLSISSFLLRQRFKSNHYQSLVSPSWNGRSIEITIRRNYNSNYTNSKPSDQETNVLKKPGKYQINVVQTNLPTQNVIMKCWMEGIKYSI